MPVNTFLDYGFDSVTHTEKLFAKALNIVTKTMMSIKVVKIEQLK